MKSVQFLLGRYTYIGGGANGINGELLMGFSIFSIEIVSILCHFMPLKT